MLRSQVSHWLVLKRSGTCQCQTRRFLFLLLIMDLKSINVRVVWISFRLTFFILMTTIYLNTRCLDPALMEFYCEWIFYINFYKFEQLPGVKVLQQINNKWINIILDNKIDICSFHTVPYMANDVMSTTNHNHRDKYP